MLTISRPNKPVQSQLSKTSLISAIAFCLTLAVISEAWAAPAGVGIIKIVDTTTPVSISNSSFPGTATFSNFSLLPALSGDESAFTRIDGSFINYEAWAPRFGFGARPGDPSLKDGTVALTTNSYGPDVIFGMNPSVSEAVIVFSAIYPTTPR